MKVNVLRSPGMSRYTMLRRFFTPASDSLIMVCSKGPRARWMMLWNLVWVPWMFGDVVFRHPLPQYWWAVTIATVVAFLLIYACVHIRPLREVPICALMLVGVACLAMPASHYASGTCLIYACAYLALQRTFTRLVTWVVPVMLVWALETHLLHWPWQATTWVLLISIAVSVAQHSMWSGLRRNADLRLSHDEVRRLAASAERERIGRDLHDLLGHTLSMVALKSELAGRLIERDPGAARREMADVERVSREALSQVRSAVSGIRAAALASEFASARLLLETAGIRMEYWCDPQQLPSDIETCLALVLREGVTNIQRHAHADRVEVSVIVGTEQAVMRIRDDGRGGVNAHGNGLTGMRERTVAHGGELWIESPRGKGTAIEVRLPLPIPAASRKSPAPNAQAAEKVAILPVRHAGSRA